MGVGLFDCGDDDEHNGVGFVEISNLFATQDEFFLGMELFDRVLSGKMGLKHELGRSQHA